MGKGLIVFAMRPFCMQHIQWNMQFVVQDAHAS